MIIMKIQRGLQCSSTIDVAAIRRQATDDGFMTFVLPRFGIVDRPSFFDAIRSTLPLDPPLVGSRSWDALSDSLWEGLYSLQYSKIVIIWPGAGQMSIRAAADFEIALNVLAEVASLLGDRRATLGATKEVVVLVEVP